ncbi:MULTISPECIES: NAD(P)H-dependent oxidoreductase [unclassified Rahnella]|uniref:NAD(P)H-dependent oxidoreductase n=1 Tax=Yersiniaceae TaxID=1903411 RepID=UPI0018861B20|nr:MULTISPECIES: NAD(P)H-dependent oxidoreductase [unclassified Rahnella]MCM2446906.1 NAD(P)H-dependent oxidoreductase [Rahnella sp. CG8]
MIVVINATRKPAPSVQGNSATRTLLNNALEKVTPHYDSFKYYDIRDMDLPFFDARETKLYNSLDLNNLLTDLVKAKGVFLGVPGYWSGVSGCFKNLIDLICGAHYDSLEPETVLKGKYFAGFSVGTDNLTTLRTAEQTYSILVSTGALPAERIIPIPNPRSASFDLETSEILILNALVQLIKSIEL